jgi:hypothetical protein
VTSRFGKVEDEDVEKIVLTMRNCYRRLEPHKVELVDLYVFQHSSTVNAFLTAESKKIGVASHLSFSEQFFSLHDAWLGTPRIIICLEKMKNLSQLAQKGGIRHEVGHTILHGNLNHYMFPIPATLQSLAQRFSLSRHYVTNMLYLISIAVKDYEVSRLLKSRGYIKCQIAFGKHVLAPTEDDRLSWKMSKGRADMEALCLVSHLKSIGYATPFLLEETPRKTLRLILHHGLSFLPKEHRAALLEHVPKMFQQLGMDTADNVSKFTRLIVKKLIEPCFENHGKN